MGWSLLRGQLIARGMTTAQELLEAGPTGNVSIDYSRIPESWGDIPPLRIDR